MGNDINDSMLSSPDETMKSLNDTVLKIVNRPVASAAAKRRIRDFNDIESKPVPWLIPKFIARQGLNSVMGLPGAGKSWFMSALAAAVASGGGFPDDVAGNLIVVPRGRVLMANFDDSLEITAKPRLEKFGLTREDFSNARPMDPKIPFTFGDELLAEQFEEFRPDLAIFDTLQHFIGAGVDLHRANETTAALVKLKNLCERYNTAAVVVQHISKMAASGNGGASVSWGLGSMAIPGIFRSVWTIGQLSREGDPPGLRALVPSKTNLIPYTPSARLFRLDQERGFIWAGVDGAVTPRDLLSHEKRGAGRPNDQMKAAEDFLRAALANGELESAELERQAEAAGISERTLKRAKRLTGVRAFQRSGKWHSALPD